MSLLADLFRTPLSRSHSARFVEWNGVFYMAAGALMLAWPAAVQVIFRDPAFAGNEGSLFRVIGMCVLVIGWFYFFGGRSEARQITVASVVDRIILVPLVLAPLAISGVYPNTLLAFAVLDPILGGIAWWMLVKEGKSAE